jgi:GNAT superfamily N-acetyltransferase
MTTDIRIAGEEDRGAVVHVLRTALNFPARWVEQRGPVLPLEDFRCAFVDGALVAGAGELHWRQWFAGRDQPMSGIFGVATLPEQRGGGLASEVVLAIIREARAGGSPSRPCTPRSSGPTAASGTSWPGPSPSTAWPSTRSRRTWVARPGWS